MTPDYILNIDLQTSFDWSLYGDVVIGGADSPIYAPYISGYCRLLLRNKSTINHTADVYLKFRVEVSIPDLYSSYHNSDLSLPITYGFSGGYYNHYLDDIITLTYVYDDSNELTTYDTLNIPDSESRQLNLKLTPTHTTYIDGSLLYMYHSGTAEVYLGQIEWPDEALTIKPDGTFRMTLINDVAYGTNISSSDILFNTYTNDNISDSVYIPVVRPQEDYIALASSHEIYIYGESGTSPQIYDSYIFIRDAGWVPFSIRLFDE